MASNMVGWFEIYVKDMDRARKFYETVFQVQLTKMEMPEGMTDEMYSFPGDMEAANYGSPGALVKMDGYEPSGKGTIVYFSSADCAVEESRVAEAGGKVITPKTSIGAYGHMCLISDSEGNTIGIHSME